MKCVNFSAWYYVRSASDKLSIKNNDQRNVFNVFKFTWNKNFFNNSSLPPSQQLSIERKKFVGVNTVIHTVFSGTSREFFFPFSLFIRSQGRGLFSYSSIRFHWFFHEELPNNKKGERLKLGWNRCLNVIFFHWRVLKDGGIEGRSLWKLALRGFPPLYVKDGFVR